MAESKLNILCLGVFDSMNSVLAPLVLELEARGHSVFVIVSDKHDAISTKVFRNSNVTIHDVEEFDISKLDQIDAVVAAPLRMRVYRRLLAAIDKSCIPTFSFATLFSSVLMKMRADIVFTIGTDKFREFKENCLSYRCIAVGNPQYDVLVPYIKTGKKNNEIKKVLVVDQGGYPYGRKGKQQLADTIVCTAIKNPDIEFKIKPRYLKSERGVQIHTSSEHLSDYIKEWPENLSEYDIPTDLERIAPEYDAMITTWSTALMDALVLKMPLILISGLDSLDVFDVRKQRVAEAYRNLYETGCVHPYSELLETSSIKDLFRIASPKYTEKMIYHAGETASDKIANVIECYCANLSSNGMAPANVLQVTYDQFAKDPGIFGLKPVNIDKQAFYNIATRRFNLFLQECVYTNRSMGNALNLTPLISNEDELEKYSSWEDLRPAVKEWEKHFEEIRSEYFRDPKTIVNFEHDIILQDYYLEWLYNTGQYDAIRGLKDIIIADSSYYYFLARVNLDCGKRNQAFENLLHYIELSLKQEIPRTIRERRIEKMTEPFVEGKNKYYWYAFLYKNNLGDVLDGFEQKQVRANSVYTLIRIKTANSCGDCLKSEELFQLYEEKYKLQKKRSKKSIKGRIKFGLKKGLHKIITVEYEKAQRKANKNE